MEENLELSKEIKVVHLCTSISDSTAALRISQALKDVGVLSNIYCRSNNSSIDDGIYECEDTYIHDKLKKLENNLLKVICRLVYNMPSGTPFSAGFFGNKRLIRQLQFTRADVIHIHWVNDGFLSIKDLKRINKLEIPIVVTTHDLWAISGGCHIPYDCAQYINGCGKCKCIGSSNKNDISSLIYRLKSKYWKNLNITITSPSSFASLQVKKSQLLASYNKIVIPNPINTDIFSIHRQRTTEKELTILFGAYSYNLPHKGFEYFKKALKQLQLADNFSQYAVRILIFGKGDFQTNISGYEVEMAGYISDQRELAKIYNRADVFVVPSLADTFNQSVAEAMACGTPVVAFDNTGVTDIIDHCNNGYLAKYKSYEDLARGIVWVINNSSDELSAKCREKVVNNFNYYNVGCRFKRLYEELIKY